jgi:hypothetical protein
MGGIDMKILLKPIQKVRILLLTVSLIIINAANGVASQVTQTYYSSADAAVSWCDCDASMANTNYGTGVLGIGNYYIPPAPWISSYMRQGSLIYFNTGSDLSGKTILSATLELYIYETAVQKDGLYNLYALAKTWNEGTVTWNNCPTWYLSPYAQAYAPQTYDEFTSWDVTDIVKLWASGSYVNYGFFVWDVQVPSINYIDNQITYYISRDSGEAQAYWPKLEVTYSCPNKPVKVGDASAAYDYIQAAYNAAVSPQTIRAQSVTPLASLPRNRSVNPARS